MLTQPRKLPDAPDPKVRAMQDEIAAAMATSHVLVITHPTGLTIAAIRRAVQTHPSPVTFAERWERGVVQMWSQSAHMWRQWDDADERMGLSRKHDDRLPEIVDGAPVRMPHHSCSVAGLLGGGTPVRPGEATLAHGGVLVMDEAPEFSRSACEGMREPLDTGRIRLVRARYTVDLPARFRLIATMAACPCGFYGHPSRACVCGPTVMRRYHERIWWLSKRDDVRVLSYCDGVEWCPQCKRICGPQQCVTGDPGCLHCPGCGHGNGPDASFNPNQERVTV